ncbi:ExbD/TolR family protein [Oleomonas cavernae]
MTPLVDVMLVLLIVFMVAAPMMTVGVPVNLPTASAKPLIEQKPPIVVSLDGTGKVFIDKTEIYAGDLITTIRALAQGDPDRRIHVRGDKALPYGRVMEVMGQINEAGFSKVALVSETKTGAPAAK